MRDATRSGAGEPGEESDQSLVLRMRAGEERAFRDFFLRFEPLALHVARRAGVQPALRREAVDEGLAGVALHLARPTSVTPERLGAYVAGALFARLRDEHSTRERHDRLEAAAAEEVHEGGESVIAGTCSAASVRASVGIDASVDVGPSPALAALIDTVREATTDEERRVLGWLAERIPQRLIADWTGVSHDVARKRIARLRARLRAAVLRRAGEMPDTERASVMRVLGRGTAPSGGRAMANDRRVRDDEAT